MAKIEDLVKRISDEKLRGEIAAEVRELKKHKQFGLVFEEHLPEMLRLPNVAIRVGNLVVQRDAPGNDVWRVIGIKGKNATCRQPINPSKYDAEKTTEFPLADLVLVVSFGEPIYPVLTPVDRIARGGPDKPWHILINADNYHALQLLLYAYEGKVDVIYVDPPYNTGARDWKYNNDYVDKTDTWRHSKWLSMIKKRLILAKRLLKRTGVLIVTIDEHEVHHLGALLEENLAEYTRQMVTIVINEKGVAQERLSRVEEYAFFCFGPKAEIPAQSDDLLSPELRDPQKLRAPRWERLLRGGTGGRRQDSPNLFYPVFVDPKTAKITGAGEPLPMGVHPKIPNDKTEAWPIRTDGSEGRWRASPTTLVDYLKKGYAKLGGYDTKRKTWTVLYLGRKGQRQIEKGVITIVRRDEVTGTVVLKYAGGDQRQTKTVWHRGTHDSGTYGSTILSAILGEAGAFAYPKSLYAVRDTLQVVSWNTSNSTSLTQRRWNGAMPSRVSCRFFG
jgi:adenine-specific DNA-methyltransferase